jgi:hypothetical protein
MSRFKLGWSLSILIGAFGLLALFASSAVASGPPIVTIGATTNHSLNTAVTHGTVDKNGANATYKFEYGKTKLYGSSTPSTSLSATGVVPVSAILAGLDPINTYHVRLSATNSFGTTVSEDLSFEMLLQWKIGGKTLQEAYAENPFWGGVPYEVVIGLPTLTAEGSTKSGTKVKVICENTNYEDENLGRGVFGVDYYQRFNACKTFLNGIETKPCQPKTPFVLDLNGVMVPGASAKLNFGEECWVGTTLDLTKGGFEIGATPEVKEQSLTLTEHLTAWETTVTYAMPKLRPTAEWFGRTFGIS